MKFQRLEITGRTRVPLAKKLNVYWWLWNDEDPQPPADFEPDNPHRAFWWWVRNPIHNFLQYVVGVCDRNYTVYGWPRADENFRSDSGETGWHVSVNRINKAVWLPYVTYSGTHFQAGFGWQASGRLACKVRRV